MVKNGYEFFFFNKRLNLSMKIGEEFNPKSEVPNMATDAKKKKKNKT